MKPYSGMFIPSPVLTVVLGEATDSRVTPKRKPSTQKQIRPLTIYQDKLVMHTITRMYREPNNLWTERFEGEIYNIPHRICSITTPDMGVRVELEMWKLAHALKDYTLGKIVS